MPALSGGYISAPVETRLPLITLLRCSAVCCNSLEDIPIVLPNHRVMVISSIQVFIHDTRATRLGVNILRRVVREAANNLTVPRSLGAPPLPPRDTTYPLRFS